MFKTLFERELRETFSSFTFLSALGVLTILTVLSAYTQARYYRSLVGDYALRQSMHQAENSNQAIVISRPRPPLLPLFNGVYDSLPDEFRLQNNPVLSNPLSGDLTPLDWLFPKIDLSFILGVLMTLIAILLAHHTIAGEREQGTLRLILACPILRRTVLAAKLASLLLSVSTALVYAVALYTLVAVASSSGTVALTVANLSVLALYTLAGLLVLLVFTVLGIAICVSLRRSSIALVVCISLWILLTLVWPSLGPYFAATFKPVSPWEAVRRERALREGELIQAELAEHRKMAEKLKSQNAGVESAWMQYLELRRKWMERRNEEIIHLSNEREKELREQRLFAKRFVSFSPYGTFTEILGSLCDTDLDSYNEFLALVEQYGREEFSPTSFDLLSRQKPWLDTAKADERVQLRHLQVPSSTLSKRLAAAAWRLGILIAEMIILMIVGIFGFERYDVR